MIKQIYHRKPANEMNGYKPFFLEGANVFGSEINSKKPNRIIAFILLCVITFFGAGQVNAQVSETKEIKKGFSVEKSTIVDINNKYGDVTIETWDKDSILVFIDYTITDKNFDKLKSRAEQIHFELLRSGHYIVINTIISSSRNMLLSELIKLKETIGMAEAQVQINIKVFLPDNLDLRIKNKFGNVYINDYKGDITLEMSNGKLKAHDLSGYVNMQVSFGDVRINSIDSGSLEVYYSEMNLVSARKLRITSKTSNITITEVSQMLVNSSRDNYRIRMIADFETQSNWTDFSITEFKQKSDINMKYGDLTIERINPGFEKILIDAHSTKINLFFDKEADANFDIITNRNMDLPLDAIIDSSEQLNDKERIMRYLGRTGEVGIAKPQLILNTSSADIKIFRR